MSSSHREQGKSSFARQFRIPGKVIRALGMENTRGGGSGLDIYLRNSRKG